MQLTEKVKLQPTEAQAERLKRTMETANAACDYISDVAWRECTFGKFKLQKRVYQHVPSAFDLTAQVVIRCIAKVSDAYKLDRKTKRAFATRLDCLRRPYPFLASRQQRNLHLDR